MIKIDYGEPCRRKVRGKGSKEENEIREIFYQKWEHMKSQTEVVCNDIEKWRSESIKNINDHANQQLRTLQDIYNKQQAAFERERKDNINIANDCRQGTNDEAFNQIKNVCQSLEYHIARLNIIKIEIEKPYVIPLNDHDTTQTHNRTNMLSRGSFDCSVSTIEGSGTVGRKSGQLVLNNGSNQTGAATYLDKNNQSNSTMVNSDSLIDKCPICLMIFPKDMSKKNRNKHVNEHEAMNQGADNANG